MLWNEYFFFYFLIFLLIYNKIKKYFVKYKLNTNESYNATYRSNFTYYVGIVGQTTNVIMNLFNILVSFGGNPKKRIPYTLLLCSAVIIFQVILAIVDSSTCNSFFKYKEHFYSKTKVIVTDEKKLTFVSNHFIVMPWLQPPGG